MTTKTTTTLYHARRRPFRRTLTVTRDGAAAHFATITRQPTQINLHGKSLPLTTTSRSSWTLHGEPVTPDAWARVQPGGGVIEIDGHEFVLTARPADVSITCDGVVVGRVARKLNRGWFMAFSGVPDVVLMLCLWLVTQMRGTVPGL